MVLDCCHQVKVSFADLV